MRLLIEPEFGAADLLWGTPGTGISIEEVPMSPGTRERLRLWQRQWDVLATQDLAAESFSDGMSADPVATVSAEVWRAHEREGQLIWGQICEELEPPWEVGWPQTIDGVLHVQWTPDGAVERLG